MSAENQPARATTAPKGRPTRSRSGGLYTPRTFGAVAQWSAVAIVLILAFLLLVEATT